MPISQSKHEISSHSTSSRILLLGGTGAMGEHLTRVLALRGFDVTVTSRKKRPSEINVNYIQGNAHDMPFLKELLNQHFDVIVDFMSYKTAEFKDRYKLFLENTNQYVYLSSSRVYANCSGEITENSPRLLDIIQDKSYLATDEYALAKARQEDLLFQSGLGNYTIIRPYITFSEERLQLGVLEKEEWLYRAIHGRSIVFSKDIVDNITTLTYGLDVANVMAELINHPKALGEAFHITLTNPLKWSDVLSVYVKTLKKYSFEGKVKLIDNSISLKDEYFKYQVLYDRYYNRQFSSEKLKGVVSTLSCIEVKSALEKCLSHFLECPKFKYIDWKKQAITDKIVGEFTPFSEMNGFKNRLKYTLYRFSIIK